MQTAMRQAAEWNRQGHSLRMGFNVSGLQFQQSNFVEMIATELAANNLSPACIDLELTESVLIKDIDENLKKLNALAKLGVRLSIDDFGTGYSSLNYLKQFPIPKLKIDRSFEPQDMKQVRQLEHQDMKQARLHELPFDRLNFESFQG